MHKPLRDNVVFHITDNMERSTQIKEQLKEKGIELVNIKIVTKEPQVWQVKCQALIDSKLSQDEVIRLFYEFAETETLEMQQA